MNKRLVNLGILGLLETRQVRSEIFLRISSWGLMIHQMASKCNS